MELPKYRCHKEVRAFKIGAVVAQQEPAFKGALCRSIEGCGHCERCRWRAENDPVGYHVVPEDKSYPALLVSRRWFAKHQPEAGGYYVLYGDGYASYSPPGAFEQGYRLVDESSEKAR